MAVFAMGRIHFNPFNHILNGTLLHNFSGLHLSRAGTPLGLWF